MRPRRKSVLAILWTQLCVAGVSAQTFEGCRPYLRFQLQAPVATSQPLNTDAVLGWVGRKPLEVVSLTPFSLESADRNTLSLLVVVWNGGLKPASVQKLAASLQHEERLHLRLSILTRSGTRTPWADDRAQQLRQLEAAAAKSSAARTDEPRYQPATSDAQVLEARWNAALRAAGEDLFAQPGKQVILELLAPPPLRPPYGELTWRILPGGNYTGEPQVHSVAALGMVPVYRVHNDTPALFTPIPFGDASHSAPLAPSGNLSEEQIDEQSIPGISGVRMPDPLPAPSPLFQDVGGRDIYEAYDAMPVILQDLRRTYTAVIRTPSRCVPANIFPLKLNPVADGNKGPTYWTAPHWLLQRDSGSPNPRE